jgi:hypothetical protein
MQYAAIQFLRKASFGAFASPMEHNRRNPNIVARPRRRHEAVSELTLEKLILREAASGNN